jgi:hypothetical protein
MSRPARRWRRFVPLVAVLGLLVAAVVIARVVDYGTNTERARWEKLHEELTALRNECQSREREIESRDPSLKEKNDDERLAVFAQDEQWQSLSARLNEVDQSLGWMRHDHPDWVAP